MIAFAKRFHVVNITDEDIAVAVFNGDDQRLNHPIMNLVVNAHEAATIRFEKWGKAHQVVAQSVKRNHDSIVTRVSAGLTVEFLAYNQAKVRLRFIKPSNPKTYSIENVVKPFV